MGRFYLIKTRAYSYSYKRAYKYTVQDNFHAIL
jgi:hypothetical protein